MPSFDVLLPIGAIGFYLFDAALMLYSNEFALERAHTHWQSSGGHLQLLGRRLFLPNPFAPGRLLFRIRWDVDARPERALDIDGLHRLTRPLRAVATLQAIIMFGLLAPVSIILGAGNYLLVLFSVFYLLTVIAVAVLTHRRKLLGLRNRQCALLALEILACAPFALNLVRKVALIRSAEVDWLQATQESFSATEKQALAECISARIEEGLAIEEPGSARAVRLNTLLEELKERLHGPVPG